MPTEGRPQIDSNQKDKQIELPLTA